MFRQLFSSFNNATANGQASTKRLRLAQQDATMPQAVEENGPTQVAIHTPPKGKGKQRGKHQGKGKGKGKGKSKTATKSAGTPPVAQMTDDPWNFGPWTDPHTWGQRQWLGPAGTAGEPGGELLMQVAKLALRHEQQLHVIQQDTRLYMFLKSNQDYSVLPLMLQLATEWRTIMEKTPEKLTMSLREVMIRGWRTRLQAFQTNEEARSTARRMQWLDSLGHWNHMHWCPVKQDLVLTESHGEDRVPVHRGGDRQDQRVGDSGHRRLHQELQVHPSAQGVLSNGMGAVPARDTNPGTRRQIVDYFHRTHRQCSAPPLSRKAPAGSPPILGSSTEHPSPALVRSAPQHTLLDFPLSSISLVNWSATTFT